VIHNAAHIVHEDAPEAIGGALLLNIKRVILVLHNHANSAHAKTRAADLRRWTSVKTTNDLRIEYERSSNFLNGTK